MTTAFPLLIVDDDPANHMIAGAILTTAGWQVDRANDGHAAIAMSANRRYALILMDLQMPGLGGFAAAAAIRSGGGASAAAPILAFTATRRTACLAQLRASRMDGHVAKPFTPETLRAAAEPWRPSDMPPPLAKLAAIFGAAGIATLLHGFRGQLEEALAVDDAQPYPGAHRLAGIAGTLGFPEISRQWLAVSEGDGTASAEARISARKALAEIDSHHI